MSAFLACPPLLEESPVPEYRVLIEEHTVMVAVDGPAHGLEYRLVSEVWMTYRNDARAPGWLAMVLALKTGQLGTVKKWTGRELDVSNRIDPWLRELIAVHLPTTPLGPATHVNREDPDALS